MKKIFISLFLSFIYQTHSMPFVQSPELLPYVHTTNILIENAIQAQKSVWKDLKPKKIDIGKQFCELRYLLGAEHSHTLLNPFVKKIEYFQDNQMEIHFTEKAVALVDEMERILLPFFDETYDRFFKTEEELLKALRDECSKPATNKNQPNPKETEVFKTYINNCSDSKPGLNQAIAPITLTFENESSESTSEISEPETERNTLRLSGIIVRILNFDQKISAIFPPETALTFWFDFLNLSLKLLNLEGIYDMDPFDTNDTVLSHCISSLAEKLWKTKQTLDYLLQDYDDLALSLKNYCASDEPQDSPPPL